MPVEWKVAGSNPTVGLFFLPNFFFSFPLFFFPFLFFSPAFLISLLLSIFPLQARSAHFDSMLKHFSSYKLLDKNAV